MNVVRCVSAIKTDFNKFFLQLVAQDKKIWAKYFSNPPYTNKSFIFDSQMNDKMSICPWQVTILNKILNLSIGDVHIKVQYDVTPN